MEERGRYLERVTKEHYCFFLQCVKEANREDRQVSNQRTFFRRPSRNLWTECSIFCYALFWGESLIFIKFSKENRAKEGNNDCFRNRRGSKALAKDMRDQLTCISNEAFVEQIRDFFSYSSSTLGGWLICIVGTPWSTSTNELCGRVSSNYQHLVEHTVW